MNKIFIRTLGPYERYGWGANIHQREKVRSYLNSIGFYVLTRIDNGLDVYAIREKSLFERIFL